MEELTESARQCLVSQGIILGALSAINSLSLLLTGIVVITRANDILHFTSLTHLATLEVVVNSSITVSFTFFNSSWRCFLNSLIITMTVCGLSSFLAVAYIWWISGGYRNRKLEVRSKYLDENMSRGLLALILPLLMTFSTLVLSAVFLMLKTETSSTYDLKSAMSLYASDVTRKVIIDKLQILLECCGSISLLDWFIVDWQSADLEPGNHLQNDTYTDWDSVPFSCCCPEAPPPCIHHQLRIFGVGSLFNTGCAEKLDAAVFTFILMALIMLFISTFLMVILMYSSRKLQTSARSAIEKGDSTAPGSWWLLTPSGCTHTDVSEDCTPLLEKPAPQSRRKKGCIPIESYHFTQDTINPFLNIKESKLRNEDWESYKTESKNREVDCSEDWTRMAINASASTSNTSFLTSTRPFNSTPETRNSVSDTAVANLEVSHHFEQKIRPLYRS